ncbi:synaptotagmin-like protein 2 [Chanos chanos]|uniref:Synaptotagmin-like protein 2 n=1 Tax=Chanos chanos TaxID=29144 RepID=A0A6J2WV52_CHACN|nr:synaptotagmin-like protein 2 [Chanos chanos]
MIDLSYLSKEEQEVILAVLKRDAALKKAEEQRVKQLHKTMRDKSKLKYMSGEWFYETKSLRHGDRIHGSDIIRASMRQRKPMTILELSQIWAEKSSFVNSENKDVFVPPELSGLIEEQPAETKTKRCCWFLPPSESCITSHTNPNTDSPDTSPSTKNITKPVPRKRLLLYSSQNSLLDNTDPADRQRSSVIPRGILKHSSSSSSSGDSFPLRSPLSSPLSPQSPKSPSAEYGSLSWLDRKQVRFSPAINASDTAVLQDGRELGEHGLLDQESSSSTFSDQGEEEDTLNTITTGNGVNNSQSYGQDTKECPGSEAQGRHLTSPSCSSPMWNSKPTDRQREEKLDMFLGCRQTEMRGCDESRTQKPIDQHDYHADPHADQVSSLHASAEEKGDSVDTSPVRTTAKQTNIRPMSISKSLEDISALPSREERWKNDPRGELNLSVHDVSAGLSPTACSFLDPEQMKLMSMSVPAFRQQESNGRDSDCTSDSSFQMSTPKRSTSQANLSMSSGMASMSSVSGSVISIYSGDFGNVEVRGTIQFAINYVQKLGEFHIFVVQCKDLAVAEPKRNRSDPYVKSYLLPDKTKLGKRKTCVRKKTLNPSYNEILRYKVGIETLKTQTLNLSVWHNDNFGRNSFLGEVDIDLSEWDFNNTQMSTYPLKGRVPSTPKPHDHRGEMRVALRFVPQTHSKGSAKSGEVQIWVKDCKNLPIVRGVAIDPFVKCTVLPDTSRKSRQKTRVVKRTANPVFNHTMVYDGFRPEDLREACVELTVWDHDRLSNHFLGGLRLGLGLGTSYGAEVDWMDSNATEAALWERMTEYQNEWVEDWLPLRMLIMARSMSR